MKKYLFTILLFFVGCFSLLSQTKVDSLIENFKQQAKVVCKEKLERKISFETNKIESDVSFLKKLNIELFKELNYNKSKKKFKNESIIYYRRFYKSGKSKYLEFYFEGNYIKGEILFSFNKKARIGGAKISTTYDLFCSGEKFYFGIIDIEFVKMYILPYISNELVVDIFSHVVLSKYVNILSEVSVLKGKGL